MMRMLPGTIRECSGPPVSATAGTAGYHPGEKLLTNGDYEVETDWTLTFSDGAAQLSCSGYPNGKAPGTGVRYCFKIVVSLPGWSDDPRKAYSFVANAFLTGTLELGDEDGPFSWPGGCATHEPWYPSTTVVVPYAVSPTAVLEMFGDWYYGSPLTFVTQVDTPLLGGKCSKHIPLFY
jgi:hypothetical protein